MYSYGHPHMAGQKLDDQLEHTLSSYVRIRDVALKTCQRRWTIGISGERGSGISVPAVRHDDDDDDDDLRSMVGIYHKNHIKMNNITSNFQIATKINDNTLCVIFQTVVLILIVVSWNITFRPLYPLAFLVYLGMDIAGSNKKGR